MRISINLASRPFVELRPLLARLRLAMGALVMLSIALGVWSHALDQKAKLASVQMDALKQETMVAENDRSRNEARMRQPQNKAVLDRSIFLNQLFAEKSFSWTATMMDLERVLPVGVQVTSIEPIITKEGDVNIRLRVSGDRDRAIQLVRNLETSQRFVAPRLAGESAMTADKAKAIGQVRNVSLAGGEPMGNGVEFEIFSGYNPLSVPVAKLKPATPGTGAKPAGKAAPTVKAIPVVPAKRLGKPSADVPVAPSARPGARAGGLQ
jgi:type IV pilus assembly protein PilN